MALIHNNITVGTTPTIIAQIPNGVGYKAVQIYNNDNAQIFIGDANITVNLGSNQGQPIAKQSSLQVWLSGNDILYAVSAAGTLAGSVSVIYSA